MNSFRLFRRPLHALAGPAHRQCPIGVNRHPAEGGLRAAVAPLSGPVLPAGRVTVEGEGELEPVPRSESRSWTVVLADDHAVVRQSLKRLLHQQSDLRLVGESGNGLETLSLVKQLQPDLVITDLMMPGMNGLEVTRRIRLSFPATRVVVVSVNGDAPYVEGAFRCGASGFVLKTVCSRHLVAAIRAVLAGRSYVSPPLGAPSSC